MGVFGFEKLDVWQRSVQFANSIYVMTRGFPVDERFGLTSQLRRSSVSIAANIAEGSGRGSSKEFMRFINVAYGSLMETTSHLRIAQCQNLINPEDFNSLYGEAEQLARMLSGLRSSLKQRDQRQSNS